ncbi:aspartyl-phosphate phosphatase Spo0E family protein [Paenibacillus aestuarii]|uniref:Spo0E family sporulation regulatory protein-aspartic acid phosphatase n=1 Tax=Paenibacillus aestuarii TaxID=516965 RepID=A0ABW0K1Y0_9BACL|nr:aspartyl-phosphate phosphatase Spo0E family protein [Paenibacillus aestuarii]
MIGIIQVERAIELKRIELYEVCEQYGYASQDALRLSQELDELLNQYQQQLAWVVTEARHII